MIDLLPHVRDLLAPLGAGIELSYSGIEAEMPLIVLSEVDNRATALTDGGELYSEVTIQTDVYHEDEYEARTLAREVAAKMTASGFRRSFSSPLGEDGLFRYTMRFSVTADETRKLLLYGGN
ncbi:MAG: hypothetical protein NC084_12835 [Bacteroides sp.]|nr:hypothetical protein [Eubacterium sp.]MCM1419617.1 hypothetical protein [Roseburia sp.]MCM1463580.1 hypothetical protein [Bacteroides sp.]